MKDLNKILKKLSELGFRMTRNDGTRAKIYPLNPSLPFYSLHLGQRAVFPLVRFAKKNWGIDLNKD